VSNPASLDPTEGMPEDKAAERTNDTTEPQGQSHPQAKGKVKEVLEKAKEGYDNLSNQKIGAKIGDDPT
jgi:hypothetical protein